MDYPTEIRLFNEWLETNDVTTSGIALWHTLAYLASRSGGESSLCIPLSVIMARTKMSRSSVYRERESLRRHGLIDFDVGDGRQSTGYRIIGFEERVASHTGTQGGTQNDRPSCVESHVVFHTDHRRKIIVGGRLKSASYLYTAVIFIRSSGSAFLHHH
jgi:hypothetical protein